MATMTGQCEKQPHRGTSSTEATTEEPNLTLSQDGGGAVLEGLVERQVPKHDQDLRLPERRSLLMKCRNENKTS